MTEREQLIEAMAMALLAEQQGAPVAPMDRQPIAFQERMRREATAALSVVLERYAVVPREADTDMTAQALIAAQEHSAAYLENLRALSAKEWAAASCAIGNGSVFRVAYRAMLSESPIQQEGGQ